MRHIASLLAGIVIAPLAWILIGAATIGLDPHGFYKDAVGKPSNILAMAMFAVAGIALGLLATSRMSPAGPLTAAVILGGLFGFFRFVAKDFSVPEGLQALKIPSDSATAAGDSGVVLAIAALLAMAILFPSRWRGPDDGADRVVDTSELSTNRSGAMRQETDPFGQTADPFAPAADPFAPADSRAPQSTDRFPSVGNGYDERPTDPFSAGTLSQQTPPMPDQRSPYADEGYGARQAGYSEQRPPRFGGQQQQQQQQYGYGDEQQYR